MSILQGRNSAKQAKIAFAERPAEPIHFDLAKNILKRAEQGFYDAILDEARTGKYSTVVVGRRGERGAFFTGRIAMRLVQKVSDQALWVFS